MLSEKRISRVSEPHDEEYEGSFRCPHKIDEFEPGISLRYRRSKKSKICEGNDLVRIRELFCWIYKENTRIGYVHFTECYIQPFTLNDDFLNEMDIPSAALGALGEAVSSCWDTEEIAGFGAVLELRRVWIEPSHARDSLWARVAKHFLTTLYIKEAAYLVLKAFPLEYEGKVQPDVAQAFQRRRTAMFRHYHHHLGVELMPGWAGKSGWMWRSLKTGLPKPEALGSLDDVD